jgi:myosin heavy subunit
MAEKGIDDMVEIDELNPATLLYNLSQKYKKDGIYCYVGPILLAMNPFKFIPALATKELMNQYMEICTSSMPYQLKKSLPPHIYAISAISYRTLKDTRAR